MFLNSNDPTGMSQALVLTQVVALIAIFLAFLTGRWYELHRRDQLLEDMPGDRGPYTVSSLDKGAPQFVVSGPDIRLKDITINSEDEYDSMIDMVALLNAAYKAGLKV